MRTVIRNEDGSFSEAKPIEPKGLLKLELWLRKHGLNGAADLVASLDERGLG